MVSISIMLADDRTILRRRLRLLFESELDFGTVAEASNGRAVVDAVAPEAPDVVVMDIACTPLLSPVSNDRSSPGFVVEVFRPSAGTRQT